MTNLSKNASGNLVKITDEGLSKCIGCGDCGNCNEGDCAEDDKVDCAENECCTPSYYLVTISGITVCPCEARTSAHPPHSFRVTSGAPNGTYKVFFDRVTGEGTATSGCVWEYKGSATVTWEEHDDASCGDLIATYSLPLKVTVAKFNWMHGGTGHDGYSVKVHWGASGSSSDLTPMIDYGTFFYEQERTRGADYDNGRCNVSISGIANNYEAESECSANFTYTTPSAGDGNMQPSGYGGTATIEPCG